jgi:stage II sporulation protein D
MKRFLAFIFYTCLTICLSIIGARVLHALSVPPSPEATPYISPAPAASSATSMPSGTEDSRFEFRVLEDAGVSVYNMEEYLPGVLAAEMPASFEPEALMAQAVAARTYIMYCTLKSTKHADADVCCNPACCKAFADESALRERWEVNFDEYYQKIKSAAADTDGQYLSYEDVPIQAVFHSSSYARTEAGGALWNSLPYLVSVSSPETEKDVPNFITTVEVSSDELARTVLSAYPDAGLIGDPWDWIGLSCNNDSGRVDYWELGGMAVSGAELRSMFSLRSSDFTLEYTGECFLFTVRGYGHGVGMSQYGANVMAKNGSTYTEILSHYYPGASLS